MPRSSDCRSRPLRGRRVPGLVLAAGAALLACSCASVPHTRSQTPDPLERVNRATYKLNDTLDQYVFRPVTNAYERVTPQFVRTGISNFYDHITYPYVMANELLQGKIGDVIADVWRMFFNTVFGFGGFYDIATRMGLQKHDEDLGQTLGWWGVGGGAYLVIPALGPSTLRDAPGIAASAVTNPVFYISDPAAKYPVAGLQFVDLRSRVSKALTIREAAALDPYAFTRDAYLQRRIYLIWDGNPPRPKLEDEDDGSSEGSAN